MTKSPVTRYAIIALALAALATVAVSQQRPQRVAPAGIAVRYPEGMVHGFLELHDAGGAPIADGDLLQIPRGDSIENRMTFHFRDSSYFEESFSFTQHEVFRLRSYRLIQTGPAFGQDLDAMFTRAGNRYRVVTHSHPGLKEKVYEGTIDLPEDVSNGLVVTLLKNLGAQENQTVHIIAFTPQPRMIELELAHAGEARMLNGGRSENVAVFDLKPKLGALLGFFAHLTGKAPPDSHAWILSDQVPAFVRFQGPMYLGPVWRLDLTSPHWPH